MMSGTKKRIQYGSTKRKNMQLGQMKKYLLLLMLLGTAPVLRAQDDLLAAEDAPNPGDVPVDGGITLLLAAGAAYGVGRLRRVVSKKDI